jgi:predicted negative regulator of RcsB-dependent stress response
VRRAWIAGVLLFVACAYYNTMWRAERFADEARRLEARGRAAEAKIAWARATTKAESVLARHPRSRWADDALVLKGEGLARSGDCAAAVAPLRDARRTVTEAALVERASLAAAECALAAGNPMDAAQLLGDVVQSRHADRRARAAYLAGQAARARGDDQGALDWYARSDLAAAARARAGVMLELGRTAEALNLIVGLEGGSLTGSEWAALVDAVARAAGPDTASLALDRLLAASPRSAGERGRLLLADGDRLRATGRADAASDRYVAVSRLVADSLEGALAAVRLARVQAARAEDTAALRRVLDSLGRRARGTAGSRAVEEERALADLLRDVLAPPPGVAWAFRAAELARDSLGAPQVAGLLFLDLARRHPASIFAPKALVAALALDLVARDSILQALHAAYPTSPYTLALGGWTSPAYAVAEDSLAEALGLVAPPLLAATRSPVLPPAPGPRGPFLDDPFRPGLGAASPAAPAPRPDGPRGQRPRRPERERPR